MIFHCPACGVRATRGADDCAACGARMTRRCPSCSETVAVNAMACKYCGEGIAPRKGALRKVEPASPADIRFIEEYRATPWEDLSKGVFRRWWGTWLAATFSPRKFFQTLPTATGHRWPLGFAFGLTAQALTVVTLMLVAAGGTMTYLGHEISLEARWSSVALLVGAIPLLFLGTAVVLYGASALWHVWLKLLGAKSTFQGTLRVTGYSSAADGWLVFPFVGLALAPLVKLMLYWHGFRQVHGMSRARTLVALGVPLALAAGAIAWSAATGEAPVAPVPEAVPTSF